jgi:trans-aconitate 2-methyltransferase
VRCDPVQWDPDQYRRFAAERAQPFHDLLSLVRPAPIARAVDLGCGDGALTALAAERLGIGEMVGSDTSLEMLGEAQAHTRPGLRFEAGDLAAWTSPHDVDLVLANASLQWVPDHAGVLTRWVAALAPDGQLAVQVPANSSHPSHLAITEVAGREPYATALAAVGGPPPDPVAANVLAPEAYARLLFELGCAEQHVRLQVYGHVLSETAEVVEWVRGTNMRRILTLLPPELQERFIADVRARLIEVEGDHRPYFYAFRRILLWGRLPGG